MGKSLKQFTAGIKFKQYKSVMKAMDTIYDNVDRFKLMEHGMTISEIERVFTKIDSIYKQTFKKFAICEDCNETIYGRKFNKNIKQENLNCTKCAICGMTHNENPFMDYDSSFKIYNKTHKLSLEEMIEYVKENHPELLV